MIKPIIARQLNPVRIKSDKMPREEKLLLIPELGKAFLENYEEFLQTQNKILTQNKLQAFYNKVFPGLNIKIKKFNGSGRQIAGMQQMGDVLRFRFNSFQAPDSQVFKNTVEHETIHMLYGNLMGFPVDRFERDISNYHKKKIKNPIKRFFSILKSNYNHHNIYRSKVYCPEKSNQPFNRDEFIDNLNNAFTHNKITDNNEKIYNLRAFLRRLESEQLAYSTAEFDTAKNPLEGIKAYSVINNTYKFSDKIEIIKEELTRALKKELEYNACIYPKGKSGIL